MEFVKGLLSQRKITNQTQWYQFVKEYKTEARYRDLVGQSYPYVSWSASTDGHLFASPYMQNCGS